MDYLIYDSIKIKAITIYLCHHIYYNGSMKYDARKLNNEEQHLTTKTGYLKIF